MADYLMHFNPNHNPKTGRFDFAIGGPKKENYGGKSRSKYRKEMTKKYREEGNSSIKSRMLGNAAAKANKFNTQHYNFELKRNNKYADKANSAAAVDDREKFNKYKTRMEKAYREAKTLEKLLEQDYEMGKAWYNQEMAQFVGGMPLQAVIAEKSGYSKMYKEAKKLVDREMLNTFITNHPKEALDQYTQYVNAENELNKRFGY